VFEDIASLAEARRCNFDPEHEKVEEWMTDAEMHAEAIEW
jgi:hypothetical protein